MSKIALVLVSFWRRNKKNPYFWVLLIALSIIWKLAVIFGGAKLLF